jgi:hypothetical protein
MTNHELRSTNCHTIEIQLTQQTLEDILALIHSEGWEEQEGLRIILGAGLGYLRVKTLPENEKENGLPKNQQQLVSRLVEAESLLAAMRFRMFELQNANKNWELSNGAVFKENIGLKNLASRHIAEIRVLKATIINLEAEVVELKNQQSKEPSPVVSETQNKSVFQKYKWFPNIFK